MLLLVDIALTSGWAEALGSLPWCSVCPVNAAPGRPRAAHNACLVCLHLRHPGEMEVTCDNSMCSKVESQRTELGSLDLAGIEGQGQDVEKKPW